MKEKVEEGIPEVRFEKINDLIVVAALTPMSNPHEVGVRWGLPLLFWGDPGISKSAKCKEVCRKLGLPMHTIIPSNMQPEDISGVIVGDGRGGINTHLQVPAFRSLLQQENGMLFIDEMSCASEGVQAALLNVVLERVVGGIPLPNGVRIISAANPVESSAGGWDLSPPSANRFCHVKYPVPSVRQWGEWLHKQKGNVREPVTTLDELAVKEDMVRKGWDTNYSKNAIAVETFLEKNPELLHSMPAEGHPNRGTAWPSPRTWAFAVNALTTVHCLDLREDIAKIIVSGCVGISAAGELFKYMRELEIPRIQDLMSGTWVPKKEWTEVRPHRLDLFYAALTSLVDQCIAQSQGVDSYTRNSMGYTIVDLVDKIYEVYNPYLENFMDVSATPLKKLIGGCPQVNRENSKNYKNFLLKMRALLSDADFREVFNG